MNNCCRRRIYLVSFGKGKESPHKSYETVSCHYHFKLTMLQENISDGNIKMMLFKLLNVSGSEADCTLHGGKLPGWSELGLGGHQIRVRDCENSRNMIDTVLYAPP